MTNLDLFDSRTNIVLRQSQDQREHLQAVSARISQAVISFFFSKSGQEFHVDELRKYVEQRCGYVAPDSPGRVMRKLNRDGLVTYRVINRAKSLYGCGP